MARDQSVLRDNSGLVYCISDGSNNCYGKLLKVIVFEGSDCGVFAAIVSLHPSGGIICSDSVTGARVDDHIVSLNWPR